jgi:hypothetical protein
LPGPHRDFDVPDRDAFQRALQQITDQSAQLVTEAIEQDGAKNDTSGNVRTM